MGSLALPVAAVSMKVAISERNGSSSWNAWTSSMSLPGRRTYSVGRLSWVKCHRSARAGLSQDVLTGIDELELVSVRKHGELRGEPRRVSNHKTRA